MSRSTIEFMFKINVVNFEIKVKRKNAIALVYITWSYKKTDVPTFKTLKIENTIVYKFFYVKIYLLK